MKKFSMITIVFLSMTAISVFAGQSDFEKASAELEETIDNFLVISFSCTYEYGEGSQFLYENAKNTISEGLKTLSDSAVDSPTEDEFNGKLNKSKSEISRIVHAFEDMKKREIRNYCTKNWNIRKSAFDKAVVKTHRIILNEIFDELLRNMDDMKADPSKNEDELFEAAFDKLKYQI